MTFFTWKSGFGGSSRKVTFQRRFDVPGEFDETEAADFSYEGVEHLSAWFNHPQKQAGWIALVDPPKSSFRQLLRNEGLASAVQQLSGPVAYAFENKMFKELCAGVTSPSGEERKFIIRLIAVLANEYPAAAPQWTMRSLWSVLRDPAQFGHLIPAARSSEGAQGMGFLTIEVEIANGRIVPRDPDSLPKKASGFLTILPSEGDPTTRSHSDAWPHDYFEKTAGAFADEPFERPPQLPFEKREEW